MSRTEREKRRHAILAFVENNPDCTVSDVAAFIGTDSLTITHALKVLIWGGAVKTNGLVYKKNVCGKTFKATKYISTGEGFDQQKASKHMKQQHTTPEKPKPNIPGYRLVELSTKPAIKNQGGQGSVGLRTKSSLEF